MTNETQTDSVENTEVDENLVELTEDEEIADLKQQLEDAQSKVADYWDQIVRAKAEMENIKRRATRDVENARKFSIESFAWTSRILIRCCWLNSRIFLNNNK